MSGALVLGELEPNALKLLGHELRFAVYMQLLERPMTCEELERELERDIKRIYEAVGKLVKGGLIEEIGKEPGPRPGPAISLYRATRYTFDAEDWAAMPAHEREAVSLSIIETLVEELRESVAVGAFDQHPNRVLVRYPICTDDQGMREINEITQRAQDELDGVVSRSAARRPTREGPMRRATVALLSFLDRPA